MSHNSPFVGTHKYLWLLAHQSGYSVPSASSIQNMALQVEDFIRENSLGIAEWDIDIGGWYTVPTSPCDMTTQDIINIADPDINFSVGYEGIVTILVGSGCGGSVGGSGDFAPFDTAEGPADIHRRAVVRGTSHINAHVICHEMLHGYGLSESGRYPCFPIMPEGFPRTCPADSYRDPYTVMSAPQFGGTFGHIVARDKETLGFATPRLVLTGTFTLDDHTTGDALKIPRNASQYYYLEKRDGKVQLRINRALWDDDLSSFTDPWTGTAITAGNNIAVTLGDVPEAPQGMIIPQYDNYRVKDYVAFYLGVTSTSPIVEVFWRDGANRWNLSQTERPYRVRLDTRQFWNGTNIIKCYAWDAAGNQFFDEVRINIQNRPGGPR